MVDKDYEAQLRLIEDKRDDLEAEYKYHKKRIEESEYRLLYNIKKTDELIDKQATLQDFKLQEIYANRQSIYISMRRQQMEFDEFLDEKYRDDMAELDEEEKNIMDCIDEEKNKGGND